MGEWAPHLALVGLAASQAITKKINRCIIQFQEERSVKI